MKFKFNAAAADAIARANIELGRAGLPQYDAIVIDLAKAGNMLRSGSHDDAFAAIKAALEPFRPGGRVSHWGG